MGAVCGSRAWHACVVTNVGPRVAVVGGGIYGAITAEAIARAGCDVELWERRDDLLLEASGQNAFRLHRGYMYSDTTTVAHLAACADRFEEEFADAIVGDAHHHYAVASGSDLTPATYEERLRSASLPFKEVAHLHLVEGSVQRCYEVSESFFSRAKLRDECHRRLHDAGVRLRLGSEATPADLTGYDARVLAAYVSGGPLGYAFPYEVELVERPVIRFPGFPRHSIVLVDGHFLNIMPYLDGEDPDLFVLGGSEACTREDSDDVRHRLYRGLAEADAGTCFPELLDTARTLIRNADHMQHEGSLYGIRAREPAGVRRLRCCADDAARTIRVFAGKVSYCFDAANDVLTRLRAWRLVPADGC